MKIFSTPALLAIASANINPTHGNLFKSDTISLRRKKAKASKTSSTEAPSNEPSEGPSLNPTISDSPSIHPSLRPSSSSDPSHEPSSTPTQLPSLQPSASNVPTGGPSLSRSPSLEPSLSILPTQKSSGEHQEAPVSTQQSLILRRISLLKCLRYPKIPAMSHRLSHHSAVLRATHLPLNLRSRNSQLEALL